MTSYTCIITPQDSFPTTPGSPLLSLSLPHPIPITIPKHMIFNSVPSQSCPLTPGGNALAATTTRPESHELECLEYESDERFQLALRMELHENTIAPVYKQSHSNLQFEPCSCSHANGDSEPPYNVEGDYHYNSFGRPVVSTICRDPNELH